MNAALRPQGASKVLAKFHGIEVLATPRFGPTMSASILAGRYERREIACGLKAIPPGARILEMGAGSGSWVRSLPEIAIRTRCCPLKPTPSLIPEIHALHAHNGLSGRIGLKNCVVLSDPQAPENLDFHIAGNFLGSGLFAPAGRKGTVVQVPVQRYEDLKADFPHDVIMMDIEGAELDFLRHADLTGVKLFIAEFHRAIYGREGMRACRRLLAAKGFVMDGEMSALGVHVWRRP